MRSMLLVPSVLIVAACVGDGTAVAGPSQVQSSPAIASARVVSIAVDDAVDRLLPGLASDAAGPIGTALHQLVATVHAPQADAASIRAAITRARETVAAFRTMRRPDGATLDALELELDVTP